MNEKVWKDKKHNAKPSKIHEPKKSIDRCPNCRGTGIARMNEIIYGEFPLCKTCGGTGSK